MARMPAKKQTAFRLSPEQLRLLDRLARHLALDRTSVVRLAIQRLARQEGLLR